MAISVKFTCNMRQRRAKSVFLWKENIEKGVDIWYK